MHAFIPPTCLCEAIIGAVGVVTSVQENHTRSDSTLLPRTLFTADEVAVTLALSESLVRQLTLDGSITCRRIGRLVRYTRDDIEAFVARRDERPY